MRAIYKCRLCGEIFKGRTVGKVLAENIVLQLTTKEISKSYIGRFIVHYCKDGSIGFADFQGFKEEEEA